jgi:hypothetical protein
MIIWTSSGKVELYPKSMTYLLGPLLVYVHTSSIWSKSRGMHNFIGNRIGFDFFQSDPPHWESDAIK